MTVRILVTGANGFIGNKLIKFLVKKKYRVFGLARNDLYKYKYENLYNCTWK